MRGILLRVTLWIVVKVAASVGFLALGGKGANVVNKP